jgi:hypothetical protein
MHPRDRTCSREILEDRMKIDRLAAVLVMLGAAGCDGGYDPPEQANPSDTIAPAPHDTTVIDRLLPGRSRDRLDHVSVALR